MLSVSEATPDAGTPMDQDAMAIERAAMSALEASSAEVRECPAASAARRRAEGW